MYPSHAERMSCYLHALYRQLPGLSSVSTAVGKLDIGCHVGPGPHQYKEVICEVCSSRYQAFLCLKCSSIGCEPSASSPSPRLPHESPGGRYHTTPSSSSVSTSFQSDADRRASHSSSISTQDLDLCEANDSPGGRNARIKDSTEDAAKRHAMNEKKRRDDEKIMFETAQKTVEDIEGVRLPRCPKNFVTKNRILDAIIKCLRSQDLRAKRYEEEANRYQQEAKRYKEERDNYRRALAELRSQVQGHDISIVGCSDDTDTDRVMAMQTDYKRRRTSQQIPKAPSGMDGLLKDTTDLDVKPRLNPRPDFWRVQSPARQ